MCGIAGLLDTRADLSEERLGAIARVMADNLRHRGPDADGVWVDADAGVAFGHRRLSIVDLSAAGAQPMISSCHICFDEQVRGYRGQGQDLTQSE